MFKSYLNLFDRLNKKNQFWRFNNYYAVFCLEIYFGDGFFIKFHYFFVQQRNRFNGRCMILHVILNKMFKHSLKLVFFLNTFNSRLFDLKYIFDFDFISFSNLSNVGFREFNCSSICSIYLDSYFGCIFGRLVLSIQLFLLLNCLVIRPNQLFKKFYFFELVI